MRRGLRPHSPSLCEAERVHRPAACPGINPARDQLQKPAPQGGGVKNARGSIEGIEDGGGIGLRARGYFSGRLHGDDPMAARLALPG